jgi:hypothetical protein
MKLHRFAKAALIVGSVAALALPLATHALTLEDTGNTLGLGTADLKETVVNLIKLVLGLLGLIAVIMVIYGGFLWMTAAGNEDNVSKGKQVISAAVIGMIVVLLGWAVVTFFFNTTVNVTGGTL